MARVSLINPSLSLVAEPYAKGVDVKMPLGLLYLAGALELSGHKVQFVDAALEAQDAQEIIGQLRAFAPDVVGISCVTATKAVALGLARLIKGNVGDDAKVVLGGVHPTLDPRSCLLPGAVDYVVAGEAEMSFPLLCSHPDDPAQAPGVFWRGSSGDILTGEPPCRVTDVDSLPYPAYHHLDLDSYLARRQEFCLLASRGCPHNCSFCCSPRLWGRKQIFRQPDAVVDEITYWLGKYTAVRTFHFLDDNFTEWGEGLQRFCELLAPLQVAWRCIGRIDHLDEETVRRMAASGCISISFGVESGSPRIQRSCGKRLQLGALPGKVELLSACGIRAKAFFMFGFPTESLDEIKQTIRYALRLRRDHGLRDAAFMPLIPYPGTRIYDELAATHADGFGDVLATTDWLSAGPSAAEKLAKYRVLPMVSANEHFTGQELRCIAAHAYKAFYDPSLADRAIGELQQVLVGAGPEFG